MDCNLRSWDGCLAKLCKRILIRLRTASYSGDIWSLKAHSLIVVKNSPPTLVFREQNLPEWIESMMSVTGTFEKFSAPALQQQQKLHLELVASNYVLNECSVAYSARRMLRVGNIDQVSSSLYRNHKGYTLDTSPGANPNATA